MDRIRCGNRCVRPELVERLAREYNLDAHGVIDLVMNLTLSITDHFEQHEGIYLRSHQVRTLARNIRNRTNLERVANG